MKINTQPISKQDLSSQNLAINSIFYTIQGEGPFAGRPACFVRLAGCNLQCPFCDTDYQTKVSLSPEQIHLVMRTTITFQAVTPLAKKPLVVITGGEPFRQNIVPFIKYLIQQGYPVQIETNGTLFVPGFEEVGDNVIVICSPKTGKVNQQLLPFIDAFKYVVHHGKVDLDGLPLTTLNHSNSGTVAKPPSNPTPRPLIYVQPADEQDENKNGLNLEEAIESCMKFGYTLCVQTHKIIGME